MLKIILKKLVLAIFMCKNDVMDPDPDPYSDPRIFFQDPDPYPDPYFSKFRIRHNPSYCRVLRWRPVYVTTADPKKVGKNWNTRRYRYEWQEG